MFSQLFLVHTELEMQHNKLCCCNMQDSLTTVAIALAFKLHNFPPPLFSSNLLYSIPRIESRYTTAFKSMLVALMRT